MPKKSQASSEYRRTFKQSNPRYYTTDICSHIYPGHKYPSVTTITGNTAKPMLYAWYSVNGTKKLLEAIDTLGEEAREKLLGIYPMHDDFWRSGSELSSRATKIGTATHEEISRFILKESDRLNVFEFEDKGWRYSNKNAINAFRSFLMEHTFEPVFSEMAVASNTLGIGGRLDVIGYVDGELSIVDIKVAKAVYDEYAMQLSAYQRAVEEMAEAKSLEHDEPLVIKHRYVLRLDNEVGKYELVDMPDMLDAFIGMRDYWYAIKQFNPKSDSEGEEDTDAS